MYFTSFLFQNQVDFILCYKSHGYFILCEFQDSLNALLLVFAFLFEKYNAKKGQRETI